MKMGTTASQWRYDVTVGRAFQSSSLRRPAILHYVGFDLTKLKRLLAKTAAQCSGKTAPD
jgi:hypothetical protein